MDNFNEISVINNSTRPDTSLNTTNVELINKLENSNEERKQTHKIEPNFDAQSSASYFFNEDELANYEEHI